MGAVGTAADNAMMKSIWARLQVELFNRRPWRTRIELASAMHDYIKLWQNTRRRHSPLGMRTPLEIDNAWSSTLNNGAIADRELDRTASLRLVDEMFSAGLAGTSEGNVSHDHQHVLLNNSHVA